MTEAADKMVANECPACGSLEVNWTLGSEPHRYCAALQSSRPVGGEACKPCRGTGKIMDRVDGVVTCPDCGYPTRPHPAPSPVSADMVERLAEAVYAAEDTQSGDTIGTVIWNSDHLFYEHVEGEEIVDRAKRASMPTCRDAVRAVLLALRSLPEQDRRHER